MVLYQDEKTLATLSPKGLALDLQKFILQKFYKTLFCPKIMSDYLEMFKEIKI